MVAETGRNSGVASSRSVTEPYRSSARIAFTPASLTTVPNSASMRQISPVAGMLQNSVKLPIQVTQKDAHYLNGYNVQIVAAESK
jgi:hypothetical protein